MPLRNHWHKPNLSGNTHQHSMKHHPESRNFTHGDPRNNRMKASLNRRLHPKPQPHPIKHSGKISHKQPVRIKLPRFRVQ